jgi:FkbM family methyltransferase
MIDLAVDRQTNPLLWMCVIAPWRRLRRIQRRLGVREVRCSYFDADFLVDLRDEYGFDIASRRFEQGDLARFVKACRRLHPSVFVDVGANMGIYSCIVGRTDPLMPIVAIEPDPATFQLLEMQIEHNRLQPRARLIKAAAGATHGGQVTLLRVAGGNRGMIQVSERADGYCDADVVALDALALPRDHCIAIKIDVEGYELEVLRGGTDFFRSNRGYAQIEAFGEHIPAVADWMAAAGWRTVERYGINSMFEKP